MCKFIAERIITCQCTNENPGNSLTKRDFRLQSGNLVYKMKSQFENETLKEVLRYMIMMTIVRLRLDTPDKVEEYLGSGDVDSCK